MCPCCLPRSRQGAAVQMWSSPRADWLNDHLHSAIDRGRSRGDQCDRDRAGAGECCPFSLVEHVGTRRRVSIVGDARVAFRNRAQTRVIQPSTLGGAALCGTSVDRGYPGMRRQYPHHSPANDHTANELHHHRDSRFRQRVALNHAHPHGALR